MLQVHIDIRIAYHVWQENRAAIAATIDLLGDKFKPELRWRTSARPIWVAWLLHLTSWENTIWCLMVESLMLLVCMLTDPLWWMCWLAIFLQWIRTQIPFLNFELMRIITNNGDIMRIIQKKRAWIGPMWLQGELSSWCNGMIPLIDSF